MKDFLGTLDQVFLDAKKMRGILQGAGIGSKTVIAHGSGKATRERNL